jgi:N-acylglucosamine 2-epimerase (GlcNAc 2-epimerase)
LWWKAGADHFNGGFHEAIDLDGKPLAQPPRARSIARQAFSYIEAGRLDWEGPWREAARHALDFFARSFVSADGTVASVVGLDGKVRDAKFDLYDQAFALLAFASGHGAFGEEAAWCRHIAACSIRAPRQVRCEPSARIKPFGEPAVDRSWKIASPITFSLVAPEPRHAHGGAQFPGFGLLLACDHKRILSRFGACTL